MNAILMKDLLLTWMTFRKYILVGIALMIIGASGLSIYSSFQPLEGPRVTTESHEFGFVLEGIPETIIATLGKPGSINPLEFSSVEEMHAAIRARGIEYGVYLAEDGALTVSLDSGVDIISLIHKQVIQAYFRDMSGPIQFVSVSTDRPERFQAYMIWFSFISLLMIGNSLCNILVWEERAKGTLEELVAAPINRLEILLAKLSSVLLSTLILCIGLVILILTAIVVAATAIILNSSNLINFFLGAVEETDGVVHQASAMDIAGSFVGWADISLVAIILLSAFFALLALTTALVVVNFVVKQQATLRFMITPAVLAIYGIPFLIPFESAANTQWHWLPPIVNIYFTSAYSALHEMTVIAWLPTLGVNIIAFVAALTIGVFMIGRIQDWPSR